MFFFGAGIAALVAAQCGYALKQVSPGNGQTPALALPGSCRRDMR